MTDDWWGGDRSVAITHALDGLLDQLERRLHTPSCAGLEYEDDLLPMSTGIVALDRVLGGGLRKGTLTVVEADIAAQSNALLCSIARKVPNPCLFDGEDFWATVSWLLAGSSGLPEVSVSEAQLSEPEWDSLAAGLAELSRQDLRISSTGSLRALAGVAVASDVDVVLVDDADRFGPPLEFLPKLAMLAASSGLAVVATTGILGELPDWALRDVALVSMHGFNFGGTAALFRPDPDEMLLTVQVEVECLSGVVR